MMATQSKNPCVALSKLLEGIVDLDTVLDRDVIDISMDSRAVIPGGLFIGMPGDQTDGRRFIADAIANGAVALLLEEGNNFSIPETDVPVIRLADSRRHVGLILNRFYNFPSSKVTVIGVTGTNGKTTCTQLLSRVLDKPGRRCAVIGTLGNGYPDSIEQGTHTTPDIVNLYKLLAEFAEQGASAVCIEVSSHALEQDRVAGIAFNIAVFTNLTRDHLDYHGDMESYALAKSKLFSIHGLEHAIINVDDAYGVKLAGTIREANVTRYGFTSGDVRAVDLQTSQDGMSITLVVDEERFPVKSRLYGEFNVSNLLAVVSVLKALGWGGKQIADSLSGLTSVAGRMEQFRGDDSFPVVVVDYAHTPDALQQALTALRPHTQGKLWCVFGCGGDRDRGKRELMGAVASDFADQVVLTDDNPRNEPADQIINEIEQGITRPHLVIQPRAHAVRETIAKAAPADLVLLAGKGHEDYQEIGGQRYPYSDRELVQEILGEVA